MEKVNKKVERYIQLSKQFQKSSNDIFGEELSNYTFTAVSGSAYLATTATTGNIEMRQEPVKGKSRAEKIREQSEIKAKLAEDYDEYQQLQKELGDYFTSLNKLTK